MDIRLYIYGYRFACLFFGCSFPRLLAEHLPRAATELHQHGAYGGYQSALRTATIQLNVWLSILALVNTFNARQAKYVVKVSPIKGYCLFKLHRCFSNAKKLIIVGIRLITIPMKGR
ncbi:hypothetical protein [Prevotella pallens]|uniref:hypothetical protein n=1 Tax=Prevotella pallens TaxID=60133 RepID=UPI0028D8662B|nr:hypothetical protein [Prevotella pallens]